MERCFKIVFLIFCMMVVRVCGQQKRSSTATQETGELNRWMAERAQLMVEAHKIEETLNNAWENSQYSTPAVRELRRQYLELQEQLYKVRRQLLAQVAKAPEYRGQQERLNTLQERIKDLNVKIREKVDLPD